MVLFESRTRKSAFLREAVRALEARDIDVETVRADPETIPAGLEGRGVITIRAVRLSPGGRDRWPTEAVGYSGSPIWSTGQQLT
jgi:hypothetical protein